MRPIKLTIRAFGPYAGTQTFDFRELAGRDFFLIHGPTGAGKTTVLDAICYALYGDTSGAERDGKSMRSDLAPLEVQTEVELDFRLGGESYRIHRKPEQERPRLRGQGTTLAQQEVTLWRRTGCDDQDEGTVLASRWREAGEEVERIVGFKSEQFRQVVMLPQGKFRELLSAGSQKRQEILEVLFRTELYRRIEAALKDAARGLGGELEELRRHRTFLLQQAEAESPEALAERHAELAARLAALEEAARELEAARAAAQQCLTEGRRTEELLRDRERLAAALTVLLARGDEVDAQRRTLDRARRAAELADAERARDERAREETDAIRKRAAAETDHAAAAATHTAAEAALEREAARAEEREAARHERTRLDELAGKAAGLAEARLAAEQAARIVARSTAADEAAAATLAALARKIEETARERDAAHALAARADALRHEAEAAARLLERRRLLDDTLRKQAAAGAQADVARATLAAARERASAARTALSQLHATWIAGQAAVLAQGLAEGEPCPVCGAAHHPAPASPAHGAVPTPEELDAATRQLEETERALEEARHGETAAMQALALLDAETKRLAEELADRAATPPDLLEQEARTARAEHATAAAAAKRVATLEELLADLKAKRATAEDTAAAAHSDLAAARDRAVQARTTLTEREAGIPEPLREPDALDRARAAAAAQLQYLDQALATAQRQEAASRAALAGHHQALAAARENADTAAAKARQAREEFATRLAQAGFGDELPAGSEESAAAAAVAAAAAGTAEAAYTAAKLPAAAVTALDAEIRGYDQQLHAAREAARRAEEAARALVAPDLSALGAAEEAATRAVQECTAARAKAEDVHARLAGWLANLEEIAVATAQLEERYGVLGAIADAANGQNPQRITFQRYVLGALLDDVLIAASARLRIMSKGRFTLQRTRDQADRRFASGLELQVDDAYTGTTRPVSTLSGGEGFLASLSLALGLADVVQAYAGGIHLETIFVDEGFGTLDPESLDLALRALVDLQQGGRLVGIISHVPELRERIDARLEVIADRGGSRARFVVS
jgi:exonuclease SbcC